MLTAVCARADFAESFLPENSRFEVLKAVWSTDFEEKTGGYPAALKEAVASAKVAESGYGEPVVEKFLKAKAIAVRWMSENPQSASIWAAQAIENRGLSDMATGLVIQALQIHVANSPEDIGHRLEAFSQHEPQAVTDLLAEISETDLSVISRLLPRWAEHSPEEAANFIVKYLAKRGLAASPQEKDWIDDILEIWMARSSESASRWIESIEAPALRDKVLGFRINWLAKRGRVDEALISFQRVTNSGARGQIAAEIATTLGDRSPHEALQWLSAMRDEIDTIGPVARLYRDWARYDFTYALDHLPENLSLADQQAALRSILAHGKGLDQKTALHYLKKLPPELTQSELIFVARGFGRHSATEAAKFLQNHPGGRSDPHLWLLARDFTIAQPQEALAWARSLDKEADQRAAFCGIAERAGLIDEAYAREFLLNLPLGWPQIQSTGEFIKNFRDDFPVLSFEALLRLPENHKLRQENLKLSFDEAVLDNPDIAPYLIAMPGITSEESKLLQELAGN